MLNIQLSHDPQDIMMTHEAEAYKRTPASLLTMLRFANMLVTRLQGDSPCKTAEGPETAGKGSLDLQLQLQLFTTSYKAIHRSCILSPIIAC